MIDQHRGKTKHNNRLRSDVLAVFLRTLIDQSNHTLTSLPLSSYIVGKHFWLAQGLFDKFAGGNPLGAMGHEDESLGPANATSKPETLSKYSTAEDTLLTACQRQLMGDGGRTPWISVLRLSLAQPQRS